MSVGAASVALGPAFAVVAFTLHGRVLDETQQPVAGVCVRVNANGREGECSDAQGFFHVSDMEEREYMIDVVMRKEFHTGGGPVALSSLTIASRRSREWSCRRW